MMKFLTVLGGYILLSGASVYAAANVGWELLGNNGTSSSYAPSFQDGMAATDFFISPNLGDDPDFRNTFMNLSGNDWAIGSTLETTKFFEFSVSPLTGETLILDFFQLQLWRENEVGDVGPNLWELRSDLDGFTSPIGVVDIGSATFDSPSLARYELEALGEITSEIIFRLYGYGAGDSAASGGARVTSHKVFIEGNVVPEPSGVALFGVSAFVFLFRRMR